MLKLTIKCDCNPITYSIIYLLHTRPHLNYSLWSLLCHVMDSILVSQPIRSLHCVIEMPPPVVILHVSKSSVDSTLWNKIMLKNVAKGFFQSHYECINVLPHLCSYSVRPGGEELGDAGSVEASLRQTKGCPESCSPSSNHNSIKLMVHYWVLCWDLKTVMHRCYFNSVITVLMDPCAYFITR